MIFDLRTLYMFESICNDGLIYRCIIHKYCNVKLLEICSYYKINITYLLGCMYSQKIFSFQIRFREFYVILVFYFLFEWSDNSSKGT